MATDKTHEKEHTRNIIKEESVSRSKIQAGSIIRFKYTGRVVHDKNPLVLVLNPSWKRQLHGININYLSKSQVDKVSELVKKSLGTKLLNKINVC